MRVLLTGGTGFVGHWMEQTIPETISEARFIGSASYFGAEWRRERWDAIVHLAPVSPSYVLQSCDKLLYCSSGAVYEGQTEYAKMKRHYESMCGDAIITRLFTFSGAHLYRHALYEFIQDAKKGGPIVVKGDGSAIRSYLYGEDLGRWMWKILLEGHGIYDVGSAIHCTILEAARTVAEVIPCKIKVMNEPGVPNSRYVPDVTRARELGCVETVGLKEAIERTVKDDTSTNVNR